MEVLKSIVEEALTDLGDIVAADQQHAAAKIIEAAVIKGMLSSRSQAVDTCRKVGADQDIAHKIASAIRHENDALIANLKAMY
jgi:hypothetical protein